jgi:hypothetical protein
MPDIVCMGRLWARASEAKASDKIKRIKPHRRIGFPHYKLLISFLLVGWPDAMPAGCPTPDSKLSNITPVLSPTHRFTPALRVSFHRG